MFTKNISTFLPAICVPDPQPPREEPDSVRGELSELPIDKSGFYAETCKRGALASGGREKHTYLNEGREKIQDGGETTRRRRRGRRDILRTSFGFSQFRCRGVSLAAAISTLSFCAARTPWRRFPPARTTRDSTNQKSSRR